MRERFDHLRAMGIRTVMITGDNRLTAAAIAQEAGVDDFLAEAKPEDKLALIRKEQAKGKLVAMTGDGTNDAPALAQADVGLAMNAGTQAAKEAGNMVDLDSNPTKLIEVVEIGKQMLITRGALTTFSVANDVAKYFAIIPAMFAGAFPVLQALNIMQLEDSAIGDLVGSNFQRADYRRPRAAGVARRAVSAHGRLGAAAVEPAGLRRGRDHRALHRHQVNRRGNYHSALGLRKRICLEDTAMKKHFMISILMTDCDDAAARHRLPLRGNGPGATSLPEASQRQPDHAEWQDRRLAPHRPAVFLARIFSLASFRGGHRLRRQQLRRLEPRAHQ